jgi:hypothetical protein
MCLTNSLLPVLQYSNNTHKATSVDAGPRADYAVYQVVRISVARRASCVAICAVVIQCKDVSAVLFGV